MPTIKETAEEFQPPHLMNIADLDVVSIDEEIKEEINVEFPYSYIEVADIRYRVPTSVVTALKAMLEDNPNLKKFKVKKTGEGLKTQYNVIPLV